MQAADSNLVWSCTDTACACFAVGLRSDSSGNLYRANEDNGSSSDTWMSAHGQLQGGVHGGLVWMILRLPECLNAGVAVVLWGEAPVDMPQGCRHIFEPH